MPWTAIGLACAAGQNPYAALFILAVLARSDDVPLALQSPFTFLTQPAVIGALFVLTGAQVFADKHPRWWRFEAVTGAAARPVCAAVSVLSLLDTDGGVWLWAAAAVAAALCSHAVRLRLRRQLTRSLSGMGYFPASLTLDSAALITGLLAVLAPVAGAAAGIAALGGSAGLSLRLPSTPDAAGEAEPSSEAESPGEAEPTNHT